jgi:carnitine O-acetyltransferase
MTSDPTSSHVLVLRRGQFYYFDALDSNHQPILTERTLLAILQAIISDASTHSLAHVGATALGVLSTENRKVWAGLREKLGQDERNKRNLAIIDKALFVVCLDEVIPEGVDELCENLLCGTSKIENGIQVGSCMNRWYDKVISLFFHRVRL